MGDLSDLEKRIQVLEDVEAIKKLKARYWHSVDSQRWDDLAECYTGDAVFESPHLGRMEGRDFIVKVLKRAMRNVKTAHQGHSPEIEILSNVSARGRWALNDRVEIEGRPLFQGYGHYEDEYSKENGVWRIKNSRLTYIFQEGSSRTSEKSG